MKMSLKQPSMSLTKIIITKTKTKTKTKTRSNEYYSLPAKKKVIFKDNNSRL